ncbi:MAG: prolipoprotein diacylglyceryl transferase [Bacilli bacterium]|nr:prolipoprotein diacylglyceryl transferase [Bacilli bacterium]
MYPDLFGIPNFSYMFMLILGLISAFVIAVIYFVKTGISRNGIIDTCASGLFAIAIGIVGAILTQNLYNFIDNPSSYVWTWSMTFYGGLIFGVGGFLLAFYLLTRKTRSISIKSILIIAPACITAAHALGRIGCFLAGCCYGIEIENGLQCSSVDELYHLPTQLIESGFLFILSSIFIVIAFKKNYKYAFPVYMIAYGLFRFIIEYFRSDERGSFILGLSPSQFWCLIIIALCIPTYYLFKLLIFKEEGNQND